MKQSAISGRILSIVFAVAAIASLLPSSAAAQSGDVISAQYGADRRWANVTNQVRTSAFGVLGTGVNVATCWDPVNQPDGSCTNGGLGNGRDSEVRVTGQFTYHPLIPIIPLPDITISSESNLVINN